MRTLIVKNIATEGPGTIQDFLDSEQAPYDIVEPEEVPALAARGIKSYGALVVLGGPTAVYEMEGHRQTEASLRLIREALKMKLRVFGVCLGAQLIAHALGAKVYKGKGREMGWMDIELTDSGLMDPVLGPLAGSGYPAQAAQAEQPKQPIHGGVKVFQWHGDTFDLPDGAELLAGSGGFPNQAFRMGRDVYALQFHIEVTKAIVARWAEDEPALDSDWIEDSQYETYLERAQEVYKQFFAQSQ